MSKRIRRSKDLSYDKLKVGRVIPFEGKKYKLIEEVEDTFFSYIPDCENEQDGIDECGNYYDDDKCRVYCYETWRAFDIENNIETYIRVHCFYHYWGHIIKTPRKYNKITMNDELHYDWAGLTYKK
jgi:hypothetical protein